MAAYAELVGPAVCAGALGLGGWFVWKRAPGLRGIRGVALGGLALAALVCMLMPWVNPASFVGAALLAVSGALALRGSRLWTRATLVLSGNRHRIEDVLRESTDTSVGREGVFEGRVQGAEPVTSPSGVVCAFYRAELRSASGAGAARGSGALLSVETGHPDRVRLAGESGSVRVQFSPTMLVGRSEVRRCLIASPALAGQVLAEGRLPEEALSFETLGRMGEHCRVVGRLEKVGEELQLVGPDGGPALVLLGEGALEMGERLRRTAVALLIGSASACALSAAVLAGAL